MNKELIISQTKYWLSSFIIKYGICPFAKAVYEQEHIRFSISSATDTEQLLEILISECQYLDQQTSIETTLIIYPESLTEFDDYLDFLYLAETLLIDQNYEGIYQIASFHPQYCFEGERLNDPANYTNRSPYPMIHLLREAQLEQALKTYPSPEQIPLRNIKLTRELGNQKIKALLDQCFKKNKTKIR